MKTLFLQAPSFDGFDGGAGSRYQAKREIRSFWFPTWLAQPAALVPNSRVLDAPADEGTGEQNRHVARKYVLVPVNTETADLPTHGRTVIKADSQLVPTGEPSPGGVGDREREGAR